MRRGVVHWARLHARAGRLRGRSVARSVTGWWAGGWLRWLCWRREARSPGLEGELRLAGEGAFRVAGFAVCELAAALGMSEGAGRAYVGQAVELADRLPLLLAAVVAGEVPTWKARKVRCCVAWRPRWRFPWCPRTAHSDLDHTVPWTAPSAADHRDRPPPRTSPACAGSTTGQDPRRWSCRRVHDTDVEWTSPLGRTYTVDEHGTLPQGCWD